MARNGFSKEERWGKEDRPVWIADLTNSFRPAKRMFIFQELNKFIAKIDSDNIR